MRLTGYLLTFAGALCATAAQADEITGERDGEALVYRVGGFDSVGLGIPASVDIRVGPDWSVRASGPANALAELRVERDGRSLQLRPRNGWRNTNASLARQVRVIITMPQLASASIGGSGRMAVDRVTGESLRASVGGSGSLALGTVAVDNLAVSIGGSGEVTAAGRAAQLTVKNSGSGRFAAPDLRASGATVSAAGSGQVRAVVDGPATVSLAGSGMVDLGRGAKCTVRRAGSGRVICGS
ncbi:head GIN domain-containing protein [Sphingomonas mucosissima]|uniref:Putative auto-transporter adhesin head GIN domain-containing protein n=1 Tax=Sphingomonas mucosissima TaxID=370959 RepID=A0A245ZM11_9SPHN|nr:head GIN domain-containing protein [Sphingomonas mucosissima]OWK30780.1 hypothetical protein SPMU_17690 [Sphingomonas mucosissima]